MKEHISKIHEQTHLLLSMDTALQAHLDGETFACGAVRNSAQTLGDPSVWSVPRLVKVPNALGGVGETWHAWVLDADATSSR